MEKFLSAILHQLDQISVRGDDVERIAAVRHMVRQLQAAFDKAKNTPQTERKELSQNE